MGQRVFYAVTAPGFSPDGSFSYVAAKGTQSIGVTTSFNLEAILELGQLSLFFSYEKVPEIEVTIEKTLDGYCPLYLLATNGASTATLTGRAIPKCIVGFSIYDDSQTSASGTPTAGVYMSGLFVSSVNYSFPLDGNFTESISLVGNHKQWLTILASGNPSSLFQANFLNTDSPLAGNASGNVNRRQNLLYTPTVSTLDANNYVADPDCTILPGGTNGIPGITSSGINPLTGPNNSYAAHVQSITVNCNFNKEEIFELGHKFPIFRYSNFPLEVTTEISVLTTLGDQVSATQGGIVSTGQNLSNASIRIATKEGLRLNLGTKNKLTSSNMSGGDTGGGNQITTYSYINYNDLIVTHPQDVTANLSAVGGNSIGGL